MTTDIIARTTDLDRIIRSTDSLPTDPETEPFGSALRREFLALRQAVIDLSAALKEALDEYEYACKYKPESLVRKHEDEATLARLRAVLTGEESHD